MDNEASLLYAKINSLQAHHGHLVACLLYSTKQLHIYSSDHSVDVLYVWDDIYEEWVK